MTARKEPYEMLSRTPNRAAGTLVLIACTLLVGSAAIAAPVPAGEGTHVARMGPWTDPLGGSPPTTHMGPWTDPLGGSPPTTHMGPWTDPLGGSPPTTRMGPWTDPLGLV